MPGTLARTGGGAVSVRARICQAPPYPYHEYGSADRGRCRTSVHDCDNR